MGYNKDTKIALIALFGLDFGIRHISSCLKEGGYETDLIFFNRQRFSVEYYGNDYFSPHILKYDICSKKDSELLISLLRDLKSKILGISVSSVTMQSAINITREVKKHLDIMVVWGGIHAILAPHECIQYADAVCLGEGEIPMLELAEKYDANDSISGIKNFWIKTKGGIEKNEMRDLVSNLDDLPYPDFIDRDNKYLIDRGRLGKDIHLISASQRGVYPVMSSRGCMYRCSFCTSSVIRERYKDKGAYLRRRSVDNVINELKLAAREREFQSIRFWDAVFTYDKEWIEEFCRRYKKEIGKLFTCYSHPRQKDENIMRNLREAGLNWVHMGLQSGSEKVSNKIFFREQSNQEFLESAVFMKKLGITMRYDMISDNPYETDDDQEIATELLMKLPYPCRVQFFSLCWLPETSLTGRALKDGLITSGDLEQHTSKALNNFHMYVYLSKGKRELFW
ncbi:MAG: radical SAM protein, partial [Elusimicrobiota bacterium]